MIRFTLVAATALAAALIAPATSLAGGWATVGLSSLPDGTRPGKAWVVDLTLLQHGRMPLEDVRPSVLLEAADGGAERAFAARPTQRVGVYRARVVFPSAGEWAYRVDDGFTQVHELGTVHIGGGGERAAAVPVKQRPVAAPPDSGSSGMSWAGALAIAAAAGLLAALGTALLRRRIEPKPAEG